MNRKSILIVKLGTDDRPATEEDIKDMEESLLRAFKNGVLVTHHAVQFEILNLPIESIDVVSE